MNKTAAFCHSANVNQLVFQIKKTKYATEPEKSWQFDSLIDYWKEYNLEGLLQKSQPVPQGQRPPAKHIIHIL